MLISHSHTCILLPIYVTYMLKW